MDSFLRYVCANKHWPANTNALRNINKKLPVASELLLLWQEHVTGRRAYCFASKQIPDQGREPCAAFDAGKSASKRMPNESRFKRAAAFSGERTSTGVQPQGTKNPGPSLGPNLNEAPLSASCGPMFFW